MADSTGSEAGSGENIDDIIDTRNDGEGDSELDDALLDEDDGENYNDSDSKNDEGIKQEGQSESSDSTSEEEEQPQVKQDLDVKVEVHEDISANDSVEENTEDMDLNVSTTEEKNVEVKVQLKVEVDESSSDEDTNIKSESGKESSDNEEKPHLNDLNVKVEQDDSDVDMETDADETNKRIRQLAYLDPKNPDQLLTENCAMVLMTIMDTIAVDDYQYKRQRELELIYKEKMLQRELDDLKEKVRERSLVLQGKDPWINQILAESEERRKVKNESNVKSEAEDMEVTDELKENTPDDRELQPSLPIKAEKIVKKEVKKEKVIKGLLGQPRKIPRKQFKQEQHPLPRAEPEIIEVDDTVEPKVEVKPKLDPDGGQKKGVKRKKQMPKGPGKYVPKLVSLVEILSSDDEEQSKDKSKPTPAKVRKETVITVQDFVPDVIPVEQSPPVKKKKDVCQCDKKPKKSREPNATQAKATPAKSSEDKDDGDAATKTSTGKASPADSKPNSAEGSSLDNAIVICDVVSKEEVLTINRRRLSRKRHSSIDTQTDHCAVKDEIIQTDNLKTILHKEEQSQTENVQLGDNVAQTESVETVDALVGDDVPHNSGRANTTQQQGNPDNLVQLIFHDDSITLPRNLLTILVMQVINEYQLATPQQQPIQVQNPPLPDNIPCRNCGYNGEDAPPVSNVEEQVHRQLDVQTTQDPSVGERLQDSLDSNMDKRNELTSTESNAAAVSSSSFQQQNPIDTDPNASCPTNIPVQQPGKTKRKSRSKASKDANTSEYQPISRRTRSGAAAAFDSDGKVQNPYGISQTFLADQAKALQNCHISEGGQSGFGMGSAQSLLQGHRIPSAAAGSEQSMLADMNSQNASQSFGDMQAGKPYVGLPPPPSGFNPNFKHIFAQKPQGYVSKPRFQYESTTTHGKSAIGGPLIGGLPCDANDEQFPVDNTVDSSDNAVFSKARSFAEGRPTTTHSTSMDLVDNDDELYPEQENNEHDSSVATSQSLNLHMDSSSASIQSVKRMTSSVQVEGQNKYTGSHGSLPISKENNQGGDYQPSERSAKEVDEVSNTNKEVDVPKQDENTFATANPRVTRTKEDIKQNLRRTQTAKHPSDASTSGSLGGGSGGGGGGGRRQRNEPEDVAFFKKHYQSLTHMKHVFDTERGQCTLKEANSYLGDYKRIAMNTKKDPNSLMHAIAKQTGSYSGGKDLRRVVLNHMADNRLKYEYLVNNHASVSYHKYLEDYESVAVTCDEVMLIACADFLKKNVTVISPQDTWKYDEQKEDEIVVVLPSVTYVFGTRPAYPGPEIMLVLKSSMSSPPKKYKCWICSKTFSSLTILNFHKKDHDKVKLKCSLCCKTYSSKKTLNNHIAVKHEGKMYCCFYADCAKEFESASSYREHIRMHEKKYKYTCQICQKGFMRKDNFDTHCNQHTQTKKFTCNLCSAMFLRKQELRRHIKNTCKNSTRRTLQCHLCGIFLKNIDTFRNHRKHVHEEGILYKCPYCNGCKSYYSTTIDRHVQRNHKDCF